MFESVPSNEVGFAMELFVGSSNKQADPLHATSSESERRDLEEGTQFFFSLSFATLEVVNEEKKAALLRTSLFRAFAAIWAHYANDARRPSLCARVLGFCYLMEKTRGAVVEDWVLPNPQGPEQVVLHSAVVEAIASTALSDKGIMSERTLVADIQRLYKGRPAQIVDVNALEVQTACNWPIGASETATLMRGHNWEGNSLGAAENWPQSLKTAIDLTLACNFPMIVLWGPDLIQFYNDAYRDIMGTKHPAGLGQHPRECWPEVWQINEPVYRRVFDGETLTFEDQLFRIVRYGFWEEAYFTLCYSPLRLATGDISGVLVTVFETTSRLKTGLGGRGSVGEEKPEIIWRMAGDPLISINESSRRS